MAVIVIVAAASAVLIVVMMVLVVVVMMMVMMVLVIVVMMVLVIVVMMVLVVVVMVMLVVVVMMMLMIMLMIMLTAFNVLVMMVLLFDFREQLGCEGVAFGHRFQQLRTGQLVPRGGDNPGRCVVAAQQCNAFVELFGLHALGAAQYDRACVLNLVIKEFAKVFHIHFALNCIDNSSRAVEMYWLAVMLHALNRPDNV